MNDQIMSVDQFDFWMAFFKENNALQCLLATLKIAGVKPWTDPSLKLEMIIAGITSERISDKAQY